MDYNETFAPVANQATLRILLTLVATKDMELDQIDFVSTFLNGELDTDVYLKKPEGFTINNQYYLLKKNLYGLCQVARIWYEVLNGAFEKLMYS